MLEALNHGWPGILTAYCLALIGLMGASIVLKVSLVRMPAVVLAAVPVAAAAVVLWAAIQGIAASAFAALPRAGNQILGMAFLVVAGFVAGSAIHRWRPSDRHQRGALVMTGPWRGWFGGRSNELTLAGQGIPVLDETKHFKLIGTTGTGKTTAIRELLEGALARGDRAVIADPDAGYARRYFDTQRGDVLLSPFDPRARRWDLFAEIEQPHDADQLARSLIPDHDGSDRVWRTYARTFLTAVLRQLHRAREQDLGALYRALVNAPADELRDLLAETPAGPFLGEDNGKFFESVRSVTSTHVAAIEHLARQKAPQSLSLRRWVRDSQSGVLFLPYRASEIAALRHLISTWMRLAIFETLSAEEGDQRLWFIIDEVDALGAIDGLKDALARLRKFGARCVLGLQSIAQMRGLYGDAEAQTIVENCGTTLILRCSASEGGGTARFASQLIGERQMMRKLISRTRGGPGGAHYSQTRSEQPATEHAVLASEIEQLPDLQGFLKVASRPEWRRVEIRRPARV